MYLHNTSVLVAHFVYGASSCCTYTVFKFYNSFTAVKPRLHKWIQLYRPFNQVELEYTSTVTLAQPELATLSRTSIHCLHNVAVNSSATSTPERGHIKVFTGGVLLVIAAPAKESGQLLYSQSKVFIAGGRHILNVSVRNWDSIVRTRGLSCSL